MHELSRERYYLTWLTHVHPPAEYHIAPRTPTLSRRPILIDTGKPPLIEPITEIGSFTEPLYRLDRLFENSGYSSAAQRRVELLTEYYDETHGIAATVSQRIPTDEGELFMRHIMIRGEQGMVHVEIYTKERELNLIKLNTEHIQYVMPDLIELTLNGADDLYAQAQKRHTAIVRVVHPSEEKVLQEKNPHPPNADNITTAMAQLRALLPYTSYATPDTQTLHDIVEKPEGNPSFELHGLVYGREETRLFRLSDGTMRNVFVYKVYEKDNPDDISYIFSTRSIFDSDVTETSARVRIDSMCLCQTNADQCGCNVEFRMTLELDILEQEREGKRNHLLIAWKPGTAGLNNGSITILEQRLLKDLSKYGEIIQENQEEIGKIAWVDNRDFTLQGKALAAAGDYIGEKHPPLLLLVTHNGKKYGALEQQVTNLDLSHITLGKDLDFHNRLQGYLSQEALSVTEGRKRRDPITYGIH